MRDLLPELERWLAAGRRVALATVVEVWGSAPRPLGSKMAVTADGEMAGSVSGGCVEGAVFEEAQRVLASGAPRRVEFGVSDETAWSVGLSCGGRIEVFVEPLDADDYRALAVSLERRELVAVATVVDGERCGRRLLIGPGDRRRGGLGDEALDERAAELAGDGFAALASARHTLETGDGSVDLFVDVHAPPPRLVVVGAVHVAVHLVHFARRLGFETWVVDPRTAFATPERFAHADGLDARWPREALPEIGLDENSYLAVLSHDLKIDVPALAWALERPVRFVGALGSKKTHAKRVAALREAGVADDAIARIHAPIGLDLGGRRAEEIALAVMAQIVAARHGRA